MHVPPPVQLQICSTSSLNLTETQKCLQNSPSSPCECHVACSLLECSRPRFTTHLPLPLRYNGSSPEGTSVRANCRECTKVGSQTFICLLAPFLFHFILLYPESFSSVNNSESVCARQLKAAVLLSVHQLVVGISGKFSN